MAEISDRSDDSDVDTISSNNSDGLIAYFASLYDESLFACNTYLADDIKHV